MLFALIFVRSFAMPDSDCAPITYATEATFDHAGFTIPSKTSETTCKASPPRRVARSPICDAIHPPTRLVTTPKNS